jgi:CDP-glycerol glycerophosphotransferase
VKDTKDLVKAAYRKSRAMLNLTRRLGLEKITGQNSAKGSGHLELDKSKSGNIVRKAGPPQLSVIVPAYNVDDFLEDCVHSITRQTYTNWEMLIIDDGSPGRTGEIADELARADSRITVVHQENQGLGAARNTGIRESKAPYLTFIDSDDVIPENAFEIMMNSLESSRSDVAIGSMERFNSTRRWIPFWVHLTHDVDRIGITAVDHPPVMWDVFACNKIFRRSVWNETVGEFPTGTLYEDQECTAKLFVSGAKLDLLTDVVYHWRLREDGQSITQNKAETRDLQQRMAVAVKVGNIVGNAPRQFVDYWYTKCLGEDFFYYYREVPRADDEFFLVLQSGIRKFYDAATKQAIQDIAPERRWLAYLAAYGTKDQLTELLVAFDSYRTYYQSRITEGKLIGSVPELETLFHDIPLELRTVYPRQLIAHALISTVKSDADGGLIIDAFAYVPNLDESVSCTARLEFASGNIVWATDGQLIPGGIGHLTADPYNEHSDSLFRMEFSAQTIDAALEDLEATESDPVDIVLVVGFGDHSWEIRNPKRLVEGAGAWPKPGEITSSGNRFVVIGDARSSTALRFLKPRFRVDSLSMTGDGIFVEMQLQVDNGLPRHELFDLDHAELRLKLGSRSVGSVELARVGNSVSGYIPATMINGPSHKRLSEKIALDVLCSGKFSAALAVNNSVLQRTLCHGPIALSSSSYGYLEFDVRRVAAEVDSVRIEEEGELLVVAGHYFADPQQLRTYSPSFTLVGPKSSIAMSKMTWCADDRTFEAIFDLGSAGGHSRVPPVPSEEFILQSLLPAGQPVPATLWVPAADDLERQFPLSLNTAAHSLRLVSVGKSRALKVIVTGAGNTTSFNSAFSLRRSARALFSDVDRRIVPKTMFFESFGGNTVSSSPKEIDRAVASLDPEIKRVWSVRDYSVPVPDGAHAVVVGSEEWMRWLATSEVLVNNNNFPHYFRKANQQKYIQTWHGTPLKKIGDDVPGANLSLRYRALMKKEAGQEWDLLLAQSPWAAEHLSRAFDYGGPIFYKGYPHNDVLNDRERGEQIRRKVKQVYGLRDSQKVVLYAPTWRDNLKDPSGVYSRVDFLGLEAAAAALGDSFVILYRGHANSVFAKQNKMPSGVIDVTLHPDVNDLILVSDMMLTDYSSIMFDYVVTGKPIAFVAPDLTQYRDETRGFYFDFEAEAPGPIFSTGEAAVSWIRDLSRSSHEHSERYARFVDKFAPMDDGDAVQRLIDEFGDQLIVT